MSAVACRTRTGELGIDPLPGQSSLGGVPTWGRRDRTDPATSSVPTDETAPPPPPRRHPSLDGLCGLLDRMIVGRAARTVRDNLPAGRLAWVVVARTFDWLPAAIDVGRKDRAGDGGRYLMPHRLDWPGGPVAVGHGNPDRWPYHRIGLGRDEPGAADTNDPRFFRPTLACVNRAAAIAELDRLADDAHQASWAARMSIEQAVTDAVHAAHTRVRAEISASDTYAWPLLDETKLAELADRMLLGTDGDPDSRVGRMLERCLAPRAFLRVDPLRYVTVTLRRDAEEEVRTAIGDPRVGRKVRQVARELGTSDVEEIVRAYRQVWPADKLAADRARRALDVGPDPMASAVPFLPGDTRVGIDGGLS